MKVILRHTPNLPAGTLQLPASKSESNRALIIQAISTVKPELLNISTARDTQTMQRLLASAAYELNVLDAGTTMRFLTAYCAVINRPTKLTGTARMQERPIGVLVDALRELGANITYENKEGFPPLLIEDGFKQRTHKISIPSTISSQYISALLLVAPALPQGLHLKLEGNISSRPYIKMTLELMTMFGAVYHWHEDLITVKPTGYTIANTYFIESDWSAASYWFSTVALARQAQISLPYLKKNSLQGDSAIVSIMEKLGVKTEWAENGIILCKTNSVVSTLEQDFTHCPDLAQTVAVCCAVLGVTGKFTGLHSLRIKETDRIAALQNELAKIGAMLVEEGSNTWLLTPSDKLPTEAAIKTYDDHRMAMAFAPLATKMNVEIEEPSVVEKSYPHFWEDIRKIGISTSAI